MEEIDIDFSDHDEEFKKYLKKYLKEKESELDCILDSLEQNDFECVRDICHKILGTCLSFGLIKLDREMSKLQKHAHNSAESNLNEMISLAKSCKEHLKILRKDHK